MASIVITKEKLFRFNSEFRLRHRCRGHSLCICDSLSKMPRIFTKIDFSIHTRSNFLIINLLLNIKFGKFSRSQSVRHFFCLTQHVYYKLQTFENKYSPHKNIFQYSSSLKLSIIIFFIKCFIHYIQIKMFKILPSELE